MPAEVIDGKRIAADMFTELSSRAAALAEAGIRPGFGVIVVGDDAVERGHARRKMRRCREIGMHGVSVLLSAKATESDVVRALDDLNADDGVHGILVQLPLPSHINAARLMERIAPEKDADGYHPLNEGRVAAGRADGRPRAVALAIQQILMRSGLVVRGARVVVLGHSRAVARPVAMLLARDEPGGGAAVTLCPEWTQDLATVTRTAHVLIAAVGRARCVTADMVAPGAVVIDAGAHRVPGSDAATGDVRFETVRRIARAISPVPGGVGPVTIAALLQNTIDAAESCLRN